MENKIIAKQIIDFNKATFDNTFDAINVLQDHCEKMVNLFLQKASLFPPEGKNVILKWMETYKKGKNDFKQSVDDSFKTVEGFFVNSANAGAFSIFGSTGKMDQSVSGVDDISKLPIKVGDKSTQVIATSAGKDVIKDVISNRKIKVKGKSGTGSAKAVRKTIKPVKK
jgi:hypothetical protein